MALTSSIRFYPFSHAPGTICLLPGSSLAFKVFAGQVEVFDLRHEPSAQVAKITFKNLGPLDQFTVLQDLEHGKIIVSGYAQGKFVRYTIKAHQNNQDQNTQNWLIAFEKLPHRIDVDIDTSVYKSLMPAYVEQGQTITFGAQEKSSFAPYLCKSRERLFLGVDKSQEWSQVIRRGQLSEMLPYIYWLSQSVVYPPNAFKTMHKPSLLSNLQGAVAGNKRAEVLKNLQPLIFAGLHQQLIPRLTDSDYQGYIFAIVDDVQQSPLHLLKELGICIRSIFFQEQIDQQSSAFNILPLLPPEFSCGSFSYIESSKGHKVFIEWTKHIVRRVQIVAACDDEISLSFQKEITSFAHRKQRFLAPAILKIRAHNIYLLDNFQK